MKGKAEHSITMKLAKKLIRLFPDGFQSEYASEVMDTLGQRSAEVRRQSFPRRMFFWAREYRSLLTQALQLRFNSQAPFNSPRQGRVRRSTRWNMLRNLPVDFRRTVRGLARRPAFAAVAVMTLALGIGANTAIFSLIDQIMLRSLPYPDSERLMRISFYDLDNPQIISQATPADYLDWREQAGGSAEMAAYYPGIRDLYVDGGEPESVQTILALGDLMGVLGVAPAHGRSWLPGEGVQVAVPSSAGEPDGRPGVVVLSDALSRRLFEDPRAALRQEVRLSGRPYTVVGVMPPGFHFPWTSVEAWLPVQLTPQSAANRTEYLFRALLRLPPGDGLRRQLQSELDALAARLRQDYPVSNAGRGIRLIPLQEQMVVEVRDSLLTLWLAVGLVLLVACVNLANLMLVRNMGRGREMAVRKALGAGRLQTLWQSLLESLTLSLAGGAAGAALAWLALDAVKSLAPSGMPRLEQVAIDQRVLLFSLGLSLAAGVFFGILPALRMARQDPAGALSKGTRGASGGRSASRFQRALVAAEVALSVVLLIGAGLTLRSFIQVIQQDPGYDPEGLLAVSLYAPDYRYPEPEQVLDYFDRVVEGARALPGVESASYSSVLPLSGGGNSAWIHIREKPIPEGQSPDFVHYRIIGPDLFRTLKIPLRRGRVFNEEDRAGSPPSVLVNQAFVDRYLSGEDDPMAFNLTIGPKDLLPWMPVVGVVGNLHNNGLAQPPGPAVFLLRRQMTWNWRNAELIVRAAPGTGDGTAAQLRDLLKRIDPQIPAYRIRQVEEDIARSEGLRRSVVQLLGGFAVLALVLSGVGLFGVVSFTVGRRIPEIGIRMALGAAPSRIGSWVLRNGMVPVVIGLVLGLASSFPLTSLLSNQLYGVEPDDPLTLCAVALGLLAVAALACWQPALRATRTDPVEALRAE